ncbi:hypothetical protein VHN57_15215 [Sphingobium sp. WW5]|uniref:Uncharacterized protein n=1 Tax=Sphingobium yanoikuyae TaxID=13690 RepID=A0A6M4G2B6_SPHYA|nr:hypothetical protein [Sphingobium yanoikuyae]QJR01026.1 hypothetical protein HH800_01725 [Sphingobium yanoikuyae]
MRQSTILDSSAHELDGENVYLIATGGEELRMRGLRHEEEWEAIGFRHDLPDGQGRIWRTEAVLKRGSADDSQDLVRFRTQCIAGRPGAFLETPKKPFLIKALLKNGWGAEDGEIEVCDEPLWLEDDDADLKLANIILAGRGSKSLPIIYISATGDGEWLLTEDAIEKLAYDLGGIAHVVVEPNRRFSLKLRDQSEGRNLYGGTIGVALPLHGFIRRFFLGRNFENVDELVDGLRGYVFNLRVHMPTAGWDWTDFQEQALRSQRAAYRGSLSQADADQLLDDFTKQLDDLQEENRQLKEQLSAQAAVTLAEDESYFATDGIFQSVGKEIYPGELADRIRFAAATALDAAEPKGIDERTIAVWRRVVQRVPRSPALDDLLQDLSRATKNPKRVADDLSRLLEQHGYRAKSENKHVRLEPQAGFVGLKNITVAKTPSDIRGLVNMRKQIERILGIGNLPESAAG